MKYFKLTRAALDGLSEALDAVAEHGGGRELYIAIDDDTLKLKVDHGMWSIPFGLEPQGTRQDCRHEESLYGRCVACGKTWDEQARVSELVERRERKIVEHISDPERNQHGVPYRWVYFTDGTSAPTWPNGSINEILAQYENYIGNEVEISFYAGLITNMEVW